MPEYNLSMATGQIGGLFIRRYPDGQKMMEERYKDLVGLWYPKS